MVFFYLTAPIVLVVTVIYSVLAAITRIYDPHARIYHALMRQWSVILLALLRVRVTPHGVERLDPSRAYIYLANHSSYLDILAIGATVPNGALFVYKEELAHIPIWGWSLRISPFIMIRRADARDSMRSIERAAGEIHQRKQSVVIFPEGTRSEDGALRPFKRGGFLLAAKTGAPLVVLAIRGAFPLLPKGEWRVRPGRIDVEVGEPIEGRPNLTRNDERELQETVRRQLLEMLD